MFIRHPPLKFRPSRHGLSGAGVKAKDINHSDYFASIHRRGRSQPDGHPEPPLADDKKTMRAAGQTSAMFDHRTKNHGENR
jgi:hypothetical protein